MLDELLTLPEAAAISGRSHDALRKAAQRGRLAARIVSGRPGGGQYVTTREAVARYMAEVEAYRADPRPRWRRFGAEVFTIEEANDLVPEESE